MNRHFQVKSKNFVSNKKMVNNFKLTGIQAVFGDCNTYIDNIVQLEKFLSDSEKFQMDKFHFVEDKICYLIVHSLLKKQLSEEYNENIISRVINYPENGKPYINGITVDFNISHSKHYFAYVIANNSEFRVGIDIEKVKQIVDMNSISSSYFSPIEHTYIFQPINDFTEQLYRFYEIWTRKEAFLKMIGVGLYADLSQVTVTPGKNSFDLELPDDLKLFSSQAHIYTKRFKDFIVSVSLSK